VGLVRRRRLINRRISRTSTYGVLGRGRPQIRAQDSVPGKITINELLRTLRPTSSTRSCSAPSSRRQTWARRQWARRLLRVRSEWPANWWKSPSLRAGARNRHGYGAVVLLAQPRVQEGQGLPCGADLTGKPTPRRDVQRTSSSRNCRE